ncbi:MAG: hypothetical protein WD294_02465 [Phycisphaeraceae bacterium]
MLPSLMLRAKVGIRERLKRRGAYDLWRARLEQSREWSKYEVERFQLQQVQKIFRQASLIPYYRRIFSENRVDPNNFRSIDELAKLPTLSKAIIRRHREEFVVPHASIMKRQTSTSGSSGEPLTFPQSLDALQAEQAFIDFIWADAGFRPTARVAVFRGNVLGKRRSMQVGRMLYLSGYHLDPDDLIDHLRVLDAFQPDYIHAYPSVLTHLAAYAQQCELKPTCSPRAALCGSEATYEYQRELIKQVFGCRTLTWYGMSEQVALASECQDGTYFFWPQYSCVEFEKAECKGFEVVGTGWLNNSFPLIRYRTGDLVDGVQYDAMSDCGVVGTKVAHIVGREQEVVQLASGKTMPFNHIVCSMHGEAWKGVSQYQFVQNAPGAVDLYLVVPKSVDGPNRLLREFSKRTEGQLKVVVHRVDKLEEVGRAKARHFISNL